jgi:hypothetical protein
MLTETEKRYVAKGYTLPPGLTWPVVHTDRKLLGLEPWLVPIEAAPNLCTWSIPTPRPAPPKK